MNRNKSGRLVNKFLGKIKMSFAQSVPVSPRNSEDYFSSDSNIDDRQLETEPAPLISFQTCNSSQKFQSQKQAYFPEQKLRATSKDHKALFKVSEQANPIDVVETEPNGNDAQQPKPSERPTQLSRLLFGGLHKSQTLRDSQANRRLNISFNSTQSRNDFAQHRQPFLRQMTFENNRHSEAPSRILRSGPSTSLLDSNSDIALILREMQSLQENFQQLQKKNTELEMRVFGRTNQQASLQLSQSSSESVSNTPSPRQFSGEMSFGRLAENPRKKERAKSGGTGEVEVKDSQYTSPAFASESNQPRQRMPYQMRIRYERQNSRDELVVSNAVAKSPLRRPATNSQEETKDQHHSRQLDILVENVEFNETMVCDQNNNPQAEEFTQKNQNDDFFSLLQLNLENQLSCAIVTPKVKKAKKKRKPIMDSSFAKSDILSSENSNSISRDESDHSFSSESTMSPCFLPTAKKTAKEEISTDSKLKQYLMAKQTLVPVEEESHRASESEFSRSSAQRKSELISESIDNQDRSEFSEDILLSLEKFDPPEMFTGEGINAETESQKKLLNFCLQLGLDPKYYEEQITQARNQSPDKVLRRSKTIKSENQTLSQEDFAKKWLANQLNDEQFNPFKLKRATKNQTSDPIRLVQQSKSSGSQKKFIKSQQLTRTQMQRKLDMAFLYVAIMAKRLQLFFETDAKRINQMNRLQTIIQNQHRKLVKLDKLRKAEGKNLHFAFMFACPLALSFDRNKTHLQMISQLNYRKEFQIIRQKLTESKAMIAITSQQCTIQNLQEVLRQKPMGLHFSGHGIQNTYENVGELHYQHQNEGDFLLLETSEGDSKLVSRQRLRNLISSASCKLKFVVVATCHSEFVGRIFLDAGAQHVVCIRKKDQVADDACLHFTHTFYSAVFSQKESICKAFEYAQLSVRINHNAKEAEMFMLLKQQDRGTSDCVETDPKNQHRCDVFGPFSLGNFIFKEPHNVTFKTPLPRMTDLIGRQKDMYILVSKIMTVNIHLLSLIGLPGVGKSSLVKATLQYIQDRSLMRGGIIYTDVRSIRDSKTFLRNLNDQLIQENPLLFGSAKRRSALKIDSQDTLNTFILLISKISYIKEDILFVIDNCDEVIEKDRQHFKILVSMILAKIPTIKILLTTRVRLGSVVNEADEEVLVLSGLNSLQSEALMKKKLSRPITIAEQNALMKIRPDEEKYSQERNSKPTKLHEHHLFKLLGGNPQSIILIAPLLCDPLKPIQLSDLYKMLTSNQLCKILENEDIEDQMLASLRLSVHVSVSMIEESDPECMQLFLLLGLLPSGLRYDELDKLWLYIQKSWSSILNQAGKESTQVGDSPQWTNAKQKLQEQHLIEEVVETQDGWDQIQDQEDDKDSGYSDGKQSHPAANGKVKIQMPLFVRNYAEAIIKKTEAEVFQCIIAEYFMHQLQQAFQSNGTREISVSGQIRINEQICSIENNMKAFILRMRDSHIQNKQPTNVVKIKSIGTLRPNIILKKLTLANLQKDQTEPPKLKKNVTLCKSDGQPGDLHHSSTMKNQEIKNISWRQENQSEDSNTLDSARRASFSSISIKSHAEPQWEELLESYNEILLENKRNNVMLDFIQRMQANLTIKPVRGSIPDKDWVRLMWRWCLKVVRKDCEKRKNTEILENAKDLSELDNALEAVSSVPAEVTLAMIEETTKQHKFKANVPRRKSSSTKFANSYILSKQPQGNHMTEQELAVLYYIANLDINQWFPCVRQLCEQYLYSINKASSMFRANICKFYAIALLKTLVKEEDQQKVPDDAQSQQTFVLQLLDEAYNEFRTAKSKWGMAVAKYMQGQAYLSFQMPDESESDGSSSSFASVRGSNLCLSAFQEALEHFEAIDQYRGCKLTCQVLISLARGASECSVLKSYGLELLELELKLQSYTNDLFIAERTCKQEIYIRRTQGEQASLYADVIRLDLEHAFKQVSLELQMMSQQKKKRLSEQLASDDLSKMSMAIQRQQSRVDQPPKKNSKQKLQVWSKQTKGSFDQITIKTMDQISEVESRTDSSVSNLESD